MYACVVISIVNVTIIIGLVYMSKGPLKGKISNVVGFISNLRSACKEESAVLSSQF